MKGNAATPIIDKGSMAEECLREYFSGLGSYVLRGVPVRQGSENVTDIDLWVYTRATAHSRHVAIVDIKNKKRGKAFERAIWVKGLQSALGADEAIIASQGVKDSAHRFSDQLNVRVISPSVFDAIIKRFSGVNERFSADELSMMWKRTEIENSNLHARIITVKSEISRQIDFGALNTWVDEAACLLRLAVEREFKPGPFTRAAYLCCSLVAIGADYLGKNHSLSDVTIRREFFRQGMLFGRSARDQSRTYLDFAESIVTEFLDASGSMAAQIRSGFEKSVERMPVQGLVDFFSRPNSGSDLLKAAIALEHACHARNVQAPRELVSLEGKMVIGLISDFAGLRRRDVLGSKDENYSSGTKHGDSSSEETKLL